LNTGETFTITVNATARNNGSHITTATATEWNNEQAYFVDQKSKGASVAMVTFGKTLTPATGNSFGEIVKYTIKATIHDQSDYRNIVINDTLPAGLELVAGSESRMIEHAVPTPVVTFTQSDKSLSWSIDQLKGDGVQPINVTLTYQARIWKEGAVTAGSTLTNSAKMGFAIQNADSSTTSFPNTLAGLQSTQSFAVKEPNVSLTQRTSTPASGETVMAGNTINHTLTVTNADGANVSPGYEMVVEETLPVGEEATAPSNVTITKNVINLVGNTDYEINTYDSATRKLIITFRNTANAVLQPGEAFTINFTTTVNTGIAAGVTLNHSAALTAYYSQPIGTERGQAYAGATPLTATYRTTNSVSSLSVTAPADKKVRPGSVVTYRASVIVPKGTSVYDIQWSQTLPAGFQFIEGTSAGPGGPFTDWIPSVSGNSSSGETLTWSTESDTSHDVVTDNINDVVLTITFNARVMNDATNIPGEMPAKTSNFSYGYKTVDGTGSVVTVPVASDTVTVFQLALTITKSLISAPSGYKAGDTVQYRLVIQNTGSETAYDTAIFSQLAANVTYSSHTLNRTPSNPGAVSFNRSGALLGWGVDSAMAADGTLDIPAGETVTLEISATVNSEVIPGEVLKNTGTVAWTSMDGLGITQERTYGPLNDGTADFTVADPTTITKSIESAPAPTYVIGDTIDYRLDVTVLQGTTPNVIVHDTLPAGVELVSVGSITGAAGVSFTTPSNPAAGSTGPISWNFGTVTNSDNGGSFTIRYQARILNSEDNDAGDVLTSASVANVTYDAAPGNIQKSAMALPGFTVREPQLVITKSYATGTYQAGDTVQVTLKVKHNSTASPYNVTAYDLEVKDLVPAGMTFVSADNGGTASGDTITWNNANTASLLNGNELTLSYVLKIGDMAKPRQTMGTTATVTWTSLPGAVAGERSGAGGINNYSATAAASFQTADHSTILKELISTGPYPVGATARYRLTFAVNEGTINGVKVTDDLPAGLKLGKVTVDLGANFTTTQNIQPATGATGTVTWEFGDITNQVNGNAADDTIVIEYTAIVWDKAETVSGSSLTNTAHLLYTDGTGPNQKDSSGVGITIVEPKLAVSLAKTPDGPFKVNETVTYTVTVSHSGDSTADAYDLRITDILPVGLNYSSTAPNPDNPGVGQQAGQTIAWGSDGAINLPLGQTYTFQINATLDGSVEPDQSMDNTVSLQWSSLPASSSDRRVYPSVDSNTVNITSVDNTAITKSIVDTPSFVIGESFDYQLLVSVNKGTTKAVTVHDALPAGVELVSVGSITGTAGISFTTPSNPVAGSTGPISWNFGTVTSSADNGSITIVYRVRIQNSSVNNAGDEKSTPLGVANVTYQNAAGIVQTRNAAPVTFTVKEPRLAMSKSYETGSFDAGDTVKVTIELWHNPTAFPNDVNAYDVVVSDPLPAGLTYVDGSADHGGNLAGNTMTWNLENFGLAYTATNKLTLTYTVKIDNTVKPNQMLSSMATTTWTSLFGAVSGERTGVGGVDDYSISAGSSLQTIDRIAFTKTITGTNSLPIGGSASYQLRLTMNEGTIDGVKVTDDLPVGMKLGSVSITYGNGTNFTTTQNIQPSIGATGTITWDFGNVTNQSNGVATDDTIVIEYTAIVWNNSGIKSGDTLTNSAHLLYTDGTGLKQKDSSGVSVTVVEPKLTVSLVKTPNGPFKVNETVTYTVTVSHSGESTADAYDLKITDVLPAGLSYSSTAPNPNAPGAPEQAGQKLVWGNGGNIDLPLGQTYRFQINATLADSVEPSQSMDNTVSLQWSSLQASSSDRRVYPSVDSNTINITSVDNTAITKSIVGTPSFVIGESFDYQLIVSINKGTTEAVTVHDALPDGVELVSVGSIAGTAGISFTTPSNPVAGSTGPISWNFGTVISTADNGTITIPYKVRIQNSGANNAGDEKPTPSNVANVSYQNAAGIVQTRNAAAVTFIVKEPRLAMSKSYETGSYVAGDTVTVNIRVWHDPTTSSNNVNAYDVIISDPIPSGLTVSNSGSGTLYGGTMTWTIPTLDVSTYTVANPLQLTYTVTIDNTVKPNQTLGSTATTTWTSLLGVVSGERTGEGGVNNYSVTAESSLKTSDRTAFAKTLAGNASLPVGASASYRLQMTINEGTTGSVEIFDILPDGMAFGGATITKGNSSISYPLSNAPAVGATGTIQWNFGDVLNSADLDNTNDFITIDYTAVVQNQISNVKGVSLNNSAILKYRDGADNLKSISGGSANVTVIEPHLVMSKSYNVGTWQAGSTVGVTVKIWHDNPAAPNNATAYNLQVTDTVPAKMINVSSINNGGTFNAGKVTWNIAQLETTVDAAHPLTLTYQVTLGDTIQPGEQISGTVNLQWESIASGSQKRTGADGPTGALNDYAANSSATTNAVDSTSFSHSLVGGAENPVGAKVPFSIKINLNEGTTSNVIVNATLPAGLKFDHAVVSNGNGGINYAGPAGPSAGAMDQIAWSFGTVQNPTNGNATDDTITIDYWVTVADLPGNVQDHTLTVPVYLEYTDGSANHIVKPDQSATIKLVEPQLAINKTGPAEVNLGTNADFTVTVQNNGKGTAWQTVVNDTLPAEMKAQAPANAVIVAGGRTLTAVADYDVQYDAATGVWTITLKSNAARIAPGETLTVTYRSVLNNEIFPAKDIINTAAVTRYYSIDSSGGMVPETRTYPASPVTAMASFTLRTPVIVTLGQVDKATASPGETLHYKVTLTNNGNTDVMNATLTTGAGVEFTPGTIANVTAGTGSYTVNPAGGANGTGSITFSGVSIGQSGGQAVFEWDITLKPALAHGTQTEQTAQLEVPGFPNPVTIDIPKTLIHSAPMITVTKRDTDVNGGSLVPGDIISYTMTIGNIGNEHAKNVFVKDLIPANTTYVADTTKLNGVAVADNDGASPLVTGMAVNTPGELTGWINAGETAVVEFQVAIQANVAPGTIILNQATLTGEGEGSGPMSPTLSDDPDTAAPLDPTRIVMPDPTAFSHTLTGGVEPTLGAKVPFQIRLNVSEGATSNVNAKATLPAGLKFDHAVISKGNTGISYTGPTGPAAGATGSIAWSFGTVLNPSNEDATDDTITIDYWVTVADIPENVQDHSLTIPAHLEYTDGSGGLVVKPEQNAGIAVVEPLLAIAKTGPAAVNLGTNADFTVTVQNSGLGTAWQTVVTDTLPAEMKAQAPVITAIIAGGRTLTASTDYDAQYDAAAGVWTITLKSNPARIAPGEALTVSYQSVLNNEVFTGKDITNTAAVTRYYSLDSSGGVGPETRTYPAGPVKDELTFTLLTPVMVALGEVDKATASPGEVLHYKVTLTNNGNTDVTEATLTTGAGVDFRSGTIAGVTAGSGSYAINPAGGANGTGSIVFSGVSIPKDGGQAVFEWDITLKPALAHGTLAEQTAQLNVPGFPAPIAVNIPKTLIQSAPALAVTKRATDLNGGSLVPGDIVKYTLAISNTGNENVKNAVLTDPIPAHTTYVAASTSLNGTAVADSGGASPLVAGLAVSTPGEATGWVNAGETATVEFQVRIDADVAPGTVIPNQATWTGAGEGSGTMTPVVSDDPDTADAADPTRITMPDLTAFSHTLIGGVEPTLGAKVPFRIRTSVSEGATPDLVVKATLPAGLKFDHAVISKGNTGISYAEPTGPAAEATGQIAWAFGAVFNPNNGNTTDDTVTIDYWVTVTNLPANVQDHTLTIPAHIEYTDGSGGPVVKPDQTAHVQLVEPQLTIGKTGPAAVALGTNADFTVTVQNNGLGTAWQTVVTDTLPAEMSDQAPVITAITAGGRALTAPGDYDVQYSADTGVWTVSFKSVPARIAPGEALTISYQSVLNNEVFTVRTISNTAAVTRYYSLDSSGGVGPETRTYPVSPVTAIASFELLTPVVVTLGEVDKPTASPGEVLHYKVTLTNNGNTDVTDATLTTGAGVDFSSGTIAGITAGSGSYAVNPTGGANGTGSIVFSGVSISKDGGQAVFEWDITLKPVLAHGTQAEQTAQLDLPGFPAPIAVNIPKTLIQSAPVLAAAKRATDLNGGSLAPGDVINYTITIGNTGNENAKNVSLTDSIPANTTYVANTTKLNGAVVADSNGASPLSAGMAVNTPGAPAGWVGAGETAVVEFQVSLGANVVSGTIISNQATLNGGGEGSGPVAPVLSDDPDTEANGDATLRVVGNVPILYVTKTVVDDDGGALNPGDTITYTVTIYNYGTAEATGLTYRDRIPDLTTYVPGSTKIDGDAAPDAVQPDGSFSYELGSLAPGAKKVITFTVQVDPGSSGQIISSQGTLGSVELPDRLTDADVNPANGSQPTDIPVGTAPALRATKQVSDVNGGLAMAGDTLVYTITLTNAGNAAATNVRLFDTVPSGLTYVAGSTRVNGVPEADNPGLVLADGLNLGTLTPQDRVIIEFQARIQPGVAVGTVIDNQARFEADADLSGLSDSDLDDRQELGNNQLNANDDDPTRIQVGGSPGSASITGTAWWDKNADGLNDPSEAKAAGWKVELTQNDILIATADTDGDGNYEFSGINPGDRYRVRFRHPATDVAWRELAQLTLLSGTIATHQDLPIQPTGIVFDAVTRQPVAGAAVTVTGPAGFDPALHLLPGEQGQQTQADGMYRLELSSGRGAPAGTYQIAITPPQTYSPSFPSTMLPPQAGSYNPGQSGSPVVPSSDPPGQGETGRYYLSFILDAAGGQMVNNHIPVDPILEGSIVLTKTAAKRSATVGDIILYTVKLENQISALIQPFSLQDRIPAGFKYVKGSARIGGVPVEPEGAAILSWKDLTLQPNAALTVTYYLVVGTGVAEGNIYKNSATAYHGITGTAISNTGVAQVQIIADPVFSDSLVIGKVFYDGNANGVQDEGEDGVAGARLITVSGQIISTDAFGRYHVPEIAVKNFSQGQNYVIKVDPGSLMKGLEFTTENPRLIRLTQGTMAKVNFGVRMPPAELRYAPDWGYNDGPVEVVFNGNRLDGGVAVKLIREGQAEIPGGAVRKLADGKVAVTFDLTGRLAGKWDIVVSNQKVWVDSERTTVIPEGFTILNPAPTVTGVDPDRALNNEVLTVAAIRGTGFRPGAMVFFSRDGREILATEVAVLSDTRIGCRVDLRGVPTGAYGVRVVNDDGKAGERSDALQVAEPVLPPAPKESQPAMPVVAPPVIKPAEPVPVPTAPIAVAPEPKPEPSPASVPAPAEPSRTAPRIELVSPDRAFADGSVLITLIGANFAPGATVKVDGNGVVMTGANITVKGKTAITCFLHLDGQPLGRYDITVTNPDGQWATLVKEFQVLPALEKQTLLKPVYFDLNKAVIRPDQLPVVKADLAVLKQNPKLQIILGGHCDERGSYEYNLGLSERRCRSIQAYLIRQGIAAERITIYSYGKKEAAQGKSEDTWQKDRRVDVIAYERLD
jgi:uncharacterized repeat protein (TIGR01451 family)/fimbrial isopeptide formation D2 family protein